MIRVDITSAPSSSKGWGRYALQLLDGEPVVKSRTGRYLWRRARILLWRVTGAYRVIRDLERENFGLLVEVKRMQIERELGIGRSR